MKKNPFLYCIKFTSTFCTAPQTAVKTVALFWSLAQYV